VEETQICCIAEGYRQLLKPTFVFLNVKDLPEPINYRLIIRNNINLSKNVT